MQVKPYEVERPSAYLTLVDELAGEWECPDPTRPEPVILEESIRGDLDRVYVVWTKWADLDHAERSEIIMDAAERKLGREEVVSITIASGLNPEEARRMRIKF